MSRQLVLPVITLVGLAGGLVLAATGQDAAADALYAIGPVIVLGPLAVQTVRAALRRRPDVDVIALLAIGGALATGEMLAAAIIAVMLSGGQALDDAAGRRAERALSALLQAAPRTARVVRDGVVSLVDVDEVDVGDLVLVAPGEVVGVDGALQSAGTFDESTLTGESVPVGRAAGDPVASGVTNVGGDVRLTATASAGDSTYAGIIRLVRQARSEKSPGVRLADRWAGWFVPLTLGVAGAAWAISGDPVRALAVLVVATPCPLLLAVPIAVVSGISRCASHGVIVKQGQALEQLAVVTAICMDKTGTVTTGRPQILQVIGLGGHDPATVLRLAGSLEQVSAHPFATAITARAGAQLPVPADVRETPGEGVEGLVEGHRVAVGGPGLVAAATGVPSPPESVAGGASGLPEDVPIAWVGIDGRWAAAIAFADPIRDEAADVVDALRASGIDDVAMLTGDQQAVADRVAAAVGITRVHAGLNPGDKVDIVAEMASRATVAMIGDGVNDAPALAAAQVGIAMGARGATASSETADIVIAADHLGGLLHARRIALATVRIARQSALIGMGLSLAAMAAAAAGHLPPAAGALLQEVIDIAAILNALRVLRH